MNISHIVGLCISYLKTTSYFQTGFIGLFFSFLFFAIGKVLFSWIKTVLFTKKIKQARLPKFIQTLSFRHYLKDKIIIFQNSKPSAFCLGIKSPRIYLSTKLLAVMNKKEIEAILLHEKYHLIKRDTLLILLATFVKGLFLLFPIMTDIITSFLRQKESSRTQKIQKAMS